jgi:NAD(P)H-flavin reductase
MKRSTMMPLSMTLLLVLSCITLLSHAFTGALTVRPPSASASASASASSTTTSQSVVTVRRLHTNQNILHKTTTATTTATTATKTAKSSRMSLSKESTTKLWSSTSDIVWSDATILSNEKACPSGKSVLLQVNVPTSNKDDYKIPGQFLQLRLDESTEPLFLATSSAPNNSKESFQFLVKTTTSTDTSWLSNILPDTVVQVSPIMGRGFALKETLASMSGSNNGAAAAKQVLLIAAGSGIAPFKACVESGILDDYTSRIYYGEWTEDDVSFRNLFTEWGENHGLKVTPALSRTTTNYNKKWYAQDAMQRDGINDPERTVVLLCGMKQMVEATKAILHEAGVPESQILTNF